MLGDPSLQRWSQVSDRHLATLNLETLQTLELFGTRLSLRGIETLADRDLPNLRSVSLYMHRMGPGLGRVLANASWREQIVSLNVCGNRLGPQGVAALFSEAWPSLATLACGYDDLGDAGALTLSKAPLPLRALNVRMNGITAVGAKAVVDAFGSHLVDLGLEDNPLGPEGIAMLASADLVRLNRLDVRDTDASGARLDGAPWASGVETLHQGAFEAPPAADDTPRWRLRLAVLGPRHVDFEEVAFAGSQVRIGRSPQCELSFRAGNLSRFHASLQAEGDHVFAVDSGSSNGTLLNRERIHRRVVREGDELIAGGVVVRILWMQRIDGAGAGRG